MALEYRYMCTDSTRAYIGYHFIIVLMQSEKEKILARLVRFGAFCRPIKVRGVKLYNYLNILYKKIYTQENTALWSNIVTP